MLLLHNRADWLREYRGPQDTRSCQDPQPRLQQHMGNPVEGFPLILTEMHLEH